MKLPSEYKKFISNYDACKSGYGRRMLRKFGFGPVAETVVEKVVEEVKPKKTRKKKEK
jgi:hypothetical protein